jgi:excisionase family DNA binding protein
VFDGRSRRVEEKGRVVNSRGGETFVRAVLTRIADPGGAFDGVLKMILPLGQSETEARRPSDIRKTLETKLRELERIKNEFAGLLADGVGASKWVEPWMTLQEIAEFLCVKPDTVYKWIKRRGMPAHKIGGLWRFSRAEVATWFNQYPHMKA